MATVARLLAALLGAGGSGAGMSEIDFITAAPVRVQVGEVAAVIVIAILRTMGASPRTIVRAFFMSAAAVGLVGTAVGAALGLLVCANMPSIGALLSWLTGAAGSGSAEVDFITSMPVRVQVAEVAMVVAVAIVLSLAAASYPAWRSTRVEPVEGLRHE